jgi:hypothetical protein
MYWANARGAEGAEEEGRCHCGPAHLQAWPGNLELEVSQVLHDERAADDSAST